MKKDCCKNGNCLTCANGCFKTNLVEPCSEYKCSCPVKDLLEKVFTLSEAQKVLEREMGIDLCGFKDLKNGYFKIEVECYKFHNKYRKWFGNEWKKKEEDDDL